MSLGWSKVDEALFAAVSGRNGARYQLIAEQLPDTDGWDWAVWRLGDAPAAARHGAAPSANTAMRAAEAAASHWDDRTPSASFADCCSVKR
jgi:hypothetical protein